MLCKICGHAIFLVPYKNKVNGATYYEFKCENCGYLLKPGE